MLSIKTLVFYTAILFMHLFHLIFIFCYFNSFDIFKNVFTNIVRLYPCSCIEINAEKWDLQFGKYF